MCGIVDADVISQVFESNFSEAASAFFNWVDSGNGRLVSGGSRHIRELNSANYRKWASVASARGKLVFLNEAVVNEREAELEESGRLISNDAHIVALAQLSGTRLLYSNDKNLHKDFKNKDLIDAPRGSVYSTKKSSAYGKSHKELLANRSLCRLLDHSQENEAIRNDGRRS